MKKIYLVWFRYEKDKEDRIRGAALNWERAELMALNLELHLQSEGQRVFEVGVKTFVHGEMFIDPQMCENRWGKEDFEAISEG